MLWPISKTSEAKCKNMQKPDAFCPAEAADMPLGKRSHHHMTLELLSLLKHFGAKMT